MTISIPERGPTIEELVRPSDGRLFGKYLGDITDRNDREHRGRLRVKVDNITDAKGIWAEPCVPYAGKGIGFFAMPPEKTKVWVEFIGGAIDRMVYCGFLWQPGELDANDYDPARVHFETGSLRIEIDDAADEIKIEIKNNGGLISIKGGEITLKANTVTQEAQGNRVVLDAAAFDVKNSALKVV